MRTHCQPCEPKPTLGFFGTIGSIISACMHAIFGIVLPTVIALAIVFLILFFIVVAVVTIADSLGWPGFITKYKQREKEKESKRMEAGKKVWSDIEGLKLLGEGEGEGGVGLGGDGDGEIIDVGDRKRRIEVEIEFLETLLRVKRERLRALQ